MSDVSKSFILTSGDPSDMLLDSELTEVVEGTELTGSFLRHAVKDSANKALKKNAVMFFAVFIIMRFLFP